MPECARCGDFTDNSAEQHYHYCDDCMDRFAEIAERGVVIEQEKDGTHIMVTARDESFDGGMESSQIDGLARGKYISDETGLPALFKYSKSGSRWELDEYLREHPKIRQQVHDRLRRVPDKSPDGFMQRIREFL